MVARFLYRLVSLFFFVLAGVFWLVWIAAIFAQLKAQTVILEGFFVGIISPIIAFVLHQCANEAWRAARTYYHDDPHWREYL